MRRGFRSFYCSALAILAVLAALSRAILLLLTRLLAAALLLTGLLAGLIALLLLARILVRILVGVLILTHPVFLQTLNVVGFRRLEDWLRDSPANTITSHEFFRSVCNSMRELSAFM
jgi:hypothetical protein